MQTTTKYVEVVAAVDGGLSEVGAAKGHFLRESKAFLDKQLLNVNYSNERLSIFYHYYRRAAVAYQSGSLLLHLRGTGQTRQTLFIYCPPR